MTTFLVDYDDRLPWAKTIGSVSASEVLRGSSETGFSVVVAQAPSEPTSSDLRELWKARAGKSADPVLVCVEYSTPHGRMFSILGPDKEAVPVGAVETMTAELLAKHALQTDSPSALVADIRRRLASIRGGSGPGYRNEGLFASHVLNAQPSRADWGALCSRSTPLLGKRREDLLGGLGYKTEVVPDGVVLRDAADGHRRAAAVLLLEDESFDSPLGRFAGSNAVTHGLALARREGVPWLILLGGSVARLFPVDPDVGVGRKGQTQTYIEVDLDLLSEQTAGYLRLLFSPEALADGGTVETLLAESKKYATGLSDRLRDRIYEDVIPGLAEAIGNAYEIWDEAVEDQRALLDEAYHQAMIVLFRLLFVAYAEDRGLLPFDTNDAYRNNALKTLADGILQNPEQEFSDQSTSLWDDLTQVWKVIDKGDVQRMGVPAYNGGLFTADATKNESGAATYKLALTNAEIGPVLRGLLIDQTEDGVLGLVDFRALDVREFGTIYEGLLQSSLAIADTDLTLDSEETFVPAGKNDQVWVDEGEIYFHSRAGTRKATGSYFTKPFAVQHLLDQALEPALDKHLARVKSLVDKGAHRTAAEALFDFRVADLSMGSAHFLVAAIDRIEARFSEFLALNPLAEVAAELHQLRTVAAQHLEVDPKDVGIDDAVLLRRQIARRCIYGLDLNEIAVELARLAVWIHTFVPGLPLSFLNHGLVHGNSLTGVGSLGEIVQALDEAQARELPKSTASALFSLEEPLRQLLDRAGDALSELAALSDASIADVAEAAAIQEDINRSLEPLAALCDLITAERTTRKLGKTDPDKLFLVSGKGNNLVASVLTVEDLETAVLKHPALDRARQIARQINAAHFPVLYPEVFRRDPAGFDVILGNPPWEKLKTEEHGWWAIRFPGLRSMGQADKNKAIEQYRRQRPDLVEDFDAEVASNKAAAATLTAGPYPGIGATDIDLYAAFCWRFWQVTRDQGRVGVVLPRAALAGSATAVWREEVLAKGSIVDLTTLVNTARWAFDMEPRWTIALTVIERGGERRNVALRGPFANRQQYDTGIQQPPMTVDSPEVLTWSGSASIPLLSATELGIFAQMKRHPSLDADVGSWHFRPVAELHTTKEKRFYDFNLSSPAKGNTLPVWTGASFNLWSPGSGEPYAYANPKEIIAYLQDRRERQIRLKSTVFYGLSEKWAKDVSTLPMKSPRIAFRDVARGTDSRTMICALIPADVALVEKAPYLYRLRGNAADSAYLLGILSSIPFDWLTRRFVELKMSYELLNSFPVPRVEDLTGSPLDTSGHPRSTGQDLRPVRDRVVECAGRLAAVDERYTDWAKEVGVSVGSVASDEERDDLVAEIDALVSLLYGLSREQVQEVFSTFHRRWDYQQRLDAVMEHYDQWADRISGGTGK